jgi:hypothetical protein
MAQQKTKIILHGGYSRVDNDLNRSFFAELVKDMPPGGAVLLCYFAYEGDYSKHVAAHTAFVHAARSDVRVMVANEDAFESEVRHADAVYLNGGHTPRLFSALQKYPFGEMIRGKVVAGSSAGAYVLAHKGAAHTGEEARLGLGITRKNVVCHFESETLQPTKQSLRELQEDVEREIVYLGDFEWKCFEV